MVLTSLLSTDTERKKLGSAICIIVLNFVVVLSFEPGRAMWLAFLPCNLTSFHLNEQILCSVLEFKYYYLD